MSLDISFTAPTCPTCKCGGWSRSFDITHNLADMAGACGLYSILWRGDEHGITRAGQMIGALQNGRSQLLAEPDKFRKLNSPNGWGKYDDFFRFVGDVLEHCEANPDDSVEFSR